MGELYHFTCEHGRSALGAGGDLLPMRDILGEARVIPWPGEFLWLTDLSTPDREGLGLTMRLTKCDRTRYRYRVTDDTAVLPWHKVARALARGDRLDLEAVHGARPAHWFVAAEPVPAVYDPEACHG